MKATDKQPSGGEITDRTQAILKGEAYYRGFLIQPVQVMDKTLESVKTKKYTTQRVYRQGVIDKVFPSKADACTFIDSFIEGLTSYHTLLTVNPKLLHKTIIEIIQ